MRQSTKGLYPSFPLGNPLYMRGKTFHTPSEEKEDYSAYLLQK